MKIEIPTQSFVVLSQQRSGTHFLRGLLDSHPDVKCHNEVFSHGGIEAFFPEWKDSENAAEFLPYIFESQDAKACGFVVQDDQCLGNSPRNWHHELLLECDPAPLLIWLSRENTVAQYASWLIALKTGIWLRHEKEVPKHEVPGGMLWPDPEEAAEWICRKQASRIALRRKLKTLPSLEISYEELVRSPQVFCNQVFSTLGLKPHPVDEASLPQRSYRIQDVFGNFEEIVKAVSAKKACRNELKYEFTTDWFSERIPKWKERLSHFSGEPISALEIGSWEGRSAVWLLENILDHPKSTLTCIDLFAKGEAESRFDRNIAGTGNSKKVTKRKGESWAHLRELEPETYDLIYIDGSHHGRNVLEDAVLSFRLLKDGGIMIFDDYPWRGDQSYDSFPKEAIDGFLGCYRGCVEVIEVEWQLFLRKKYKEATETEPQFRRSEQPHPSFRSFRPAVNGAGGEKPEPANPINLIQVYGFHHSGTSILRKVIGNHPEVVDVEPEKAVTKATRRIQFAKERGKQGVVAKAVTRRQIDLDVFEHVDFAVLLIRDPRDVIPSLMLRHPKQDPKLLFEDWLEYAKDFQSFSNPWVKKVRYEDLFDPNWTTIREVFEFLQLDWMESCVLNNTSRRVPIHHPDVPESEPDRRYHEAFRSWQINQEFVYMGGRNRHLLPPEVEERFRTCEISRQLGYI